MFVGLSTVQKIVGGVVALAAIAGWATAFLVNKASSDLQSKLIASEARISDIDQKLAGAHEDLRRHGEVMGDLEEISARIDSAQAEFAALTRHIESKRSEFEILTQNIDAGKSEIASLIGQIESSKLELANRTQEIELANLELAKLEMAKLELAQLRSESVQQRILPTESRTSEPIVSPAPQSPTKPKESTRSVDTSKVTETQATTNVAGTQGTDSCVDARRRFQAVDKNRDDKIDRQEFRLMSVAAFDMVDGNRDGYVTIDETLLLPDVFEQFDSNGDGKLSPLEFVDAPIFTTFDSDGDRFVTLEEYMRLLRVTCQ